MPKRSLTMSVGQLREALAFLPADMDVLVSNGTELIQVTALLSADALVRAYEWRGMPADGVALLQTTLREDEVYLHLCHFA